MVRGTLWRPSSLGMSVVPHYTQGTSWNSFHCRKPGLNAPPSPEETHTCCWRSSREEQDLGPPSSSTGKGRQLLGGQSSGEIAQRSQLFSLSRTHTPPPPPPLSVPRELPGPESCPKARRGTEREVLDLSGVQGSAPVRSARRGSPAAPAPEPTSPHTDPRSPRSCLPRPRRPAWRAPAVSRPTHRALRLGHSGASCRAPLSGDHTPRIGAGKRLPLSADTGPSRASSPLPAPEVHGQRRPGQSSGLPSFLLAAKGSGRVPGHAEGAPKFPLTSRRWQLLSRSCAQPTRGATARPRRECSSRPHGRQVPGGLSAPLRGKRGLEPLAGGLSEARAPHPRTAELPGRGRGGRGGRGARTSGRRGSGAGGLWEGEKSRLHHLCAWHPLVSNSSLHSVT